MLTMERWRRVIAQYRSVPGDEVPVVLSCDGTHGPVVHGLSTAARARGIETGARVVDVQAIHPDLHVEPADLEGDEALIQRLVHWARRWCPWTARDQDHGLLLDVTGCTHLFGGEAAMLRDIRSRFALQGLTARCAMAPTPGAAQALARFGSGAQLCGAEDVSAALAPLPVAALRLDAQTTRLLDRLGLKTIGALSDLPRAALMRRFASLKPDRNPLILLDKALGKAPDPLNAPPDHRHFITRSRLPEPVIDPAPHLPALVDDLCTLLARAELGARRLRLTIYRIDGDWRALGVATARASRDPAHLRRLFDGKLENIDSGFGFDLLTLEALTSEPLPLMQDHLDGKRDPSADVAGLLDRLAAKLGADKVNWPQWRETHKPERVEQRVDALHGTPTAAPALLRERPLRLLTPPEEVRVIYAVPEGPPSQFNWRRVTYKTMRHAGPERIAPEWWRDRPGTRLRDYYKVEVEGGQRFWLYREGVIYDGRGAEPRWFLHGLFA